MTRYLMIISGNDKSNTVDSCNSKRLNSKQSLISKHFWCTANVLSAEFTDECLRTKSKDN